MNFKLVFIPPHTGAPVKEWERRIVDSELGVDVSVPLTMEEALEEVKDADAAFGTLTPTLLSAARRLRWIQAPAAAPPAGYYFKELIEHSCRVTNFRGIYNDHISVHILAMVLAFTKNLHIYRDSQKLHDWNPLADERHSVFLPDCTAVIVGFGGIGEETARLCKMLGMTVLGVDSRRTEAPPWLDTLFTADRMDDALRLGDFVILTIPHTPDTEGLFDCERFRQMKSGAFFINIGRGRTTRLNALVSALESGRLAGAGLDVFEEEPLPKNSPLWDMQNVIITPHIAATGGQYLEERRFGILLDNLRREMKGEDLHNLVDKSMWF